MTRDSESDPVELGIQLLGHLDDTELPMANVVDRIETISTHHATQRAIIETAEARGIIEREGATVTLTGGQTGPQFQSGITTMEGSFTCQKCGQSLSTGYFIQLGVGEHGPFGPTCVRKITGKE